jgi:Ca2+-binding RTX toxin-like protein
MTINLSGISAGEGATVTNIKYTYGAPETGGNDTLNGGGGSDFLFGQAGDDTFRISNARDAFGDRINGGSGLDTVKNVTAADIVLTDFRTTSALGTQTVFGVEEFDGNNRAILGREASFDGVNNDTDALDFTGINFIGVTTINLRSGDDQYIGGNTALTVNGGSGNDTMSAGVGGGKLNGDAGTDTLTGGTAATTLNGGADADFLFAGLGATTFYFDPMQTNNAWDSITGFTSGYDKIELKWSVYGPTAPGNTGSLVVLPGSGPSGTGAASKILYDNNGTDTTIYLPGTGGNAFRRIKLLGFTGSLSPLDFILS